MSGGRERAESDVRPPLDNLQDRQLLKAVAWPIANKPQGTTAAANATSLASVSRVAVGTSAI